MVASLPQAGEGVAQLTTGTEIELPTGVGEVAFDGLDGHEQLLGDLGVGGSFSGKPGDTALVCAQRVAASLAA
jgi:hypothetical protein